MVLFCIKQFLVIIFFLGLIYEGLCAVGEFNAALHQPTNQSSNFYADKGHSEVAVDGNFNSSWADSSCTHTNATDQTWWAVDLGDVFTVISINITNRDEASERLHNFSIMGSNESYSLIGTELCFHQIDAVPKGENITIICDSQFKNRYIIINKTSTAHKPLTLCEVVVLAECLDGNYGEKCDSNCSDTCFSDQHCDKKTGNCSQCKAGYKGDMCDAECQNGAYGDRCIFNCSNNCLHPPCDKFSDTGDCPEGLCQPGYVYGGNCTTACTNGTYGANCESQCSGNCLNNADCEKDTGKCMHGCKSGYTGDNCDGIDGPDEGSVWPAAVGGVLGALAILVLIVLVIIFIRNRQPYPSTPKEDDNRNEQETTNLEAIASCIGSEFNGGKPTMAVKPVVHTELHLLGKDVSSGDAYANMEGSATLVKVSEFDKYFAKRKQHIYPFQEEYEDLPNEIYPCDESDIEELKYKNRYRNIYPYNNNRVLLQQIGDDHLSTYINASYIKDYDGKPAYIAALGATKHTLSDFWRMIWEQNVQLIVMVTNLVESMKMKCEQYWPSTTEDVSIFGDVKITMERETVYTNYTIRNFRISIGSETRTLEQYQYTAWPDKSVPENLPSLCKIRSVIKSYRTHSRTPIIIHCSAGIGRTGTLIALDILLDQADTVQQVDVCKCVEMLRTQRLSMVQTLVQYVFLHDALREILYLGMTAKPCSDFQLFFRSSEGKRNIITQFETLESIKSNFKDHEMELGKVEYKDQNRDINIIPADNMRVKLFSAPEIYINAVYVEGFKRKLGFIATQTPLPNTAAVFWDVIYQLKCTSLVCLQIDPNYTQWFSTDINSSVVFDNLTVTTTSEDVEDMIKKYDITLEKNAGAESEYANVGTVEVVKLKVYLLNGCSTTSSDDTNISVLVTLGNQIITQHKNNLSVVMCNDGATECGLYIAANWLLQMVEAEKEVDVFCVVKQIRKTRPQFIPNKEQYILLHMIVQKYIAEHGEYDNITI